MSLVITLEGFCLVVNAFRLHYKNLIPPQQLYRWIYTYINPWVPRWYGIYSRSVKPGSQYDTGTVCITSIVSLMGKVLFFNSQILYLMFNFSTIWLVGWWAWLILAMQCRNRNQVYFSVTWHSQCYAGASIIIVNLASITASKGIGREC